MSGRVSRADLSALSFSGWPPDSRRHHSLVLLACHHPDQRPSIPQHRSQGCTQISQLFLLIQNFGIHCTSKKETNLPGNRVNHGTHGEC